jgi:hypothetical protein
MMMMEWVYGTDTLAGGTSWASWASWGNAVVILLQAARQRAAKGPKDLLLLSNVQQSLARYTPMYTQLVLVRTSYGEGGGKFYYQWWAIGQGRRPRTTSTTQVGHQTTVGP